MHWIRRHPTGRPPHPDILTPAEWRVLEHVREGSPNAEIAVRLGVSINTVRTHVSSMLAKLDLPDRHALAQWHGQPSEVSRRHLERTRFALPLVDWPSVLRVVLGGGAAAASVVVLWWAIGMAQDGGPSDDGNAGLVPTPTATATEEPESTSTTTLDGPHRRVFAPGETIDVAPAVLYIDPDTGDTDAWVFPAHAQGGEFGVAPDGSYIIWHDGDGYQWFSTLDQSERSLNAMAGGPAAYAADGEGFLASTQEGFVLTAFDADGRPQGDLWLGWNCGPSAAAWGSQGVAIAGHCDGPLRFSIRRYGAIDGIGPILAQPTLEVPVDPESSVSLRWSHDGERLALVAADRIRVLSSGGDIMWEFEGDFYGNPRWSPNDQHLYVNAMPENIADVAYLFTADGEPVFRFVSPFAGGCGGEVWLDEQTFHFGEFEVGTDGAVDDHVVHSGDEYQWELNDGRLLMTTPEVGHGGCATGLASTPFEPYLERPPYDTEVP